jgi:hypothetical protein
MNRPAVPFCLALTAAMLTGWSTGCSAPRITPVLTDSDPSVKIPAMELAVRQHDMSAIPVLIKNLDNDDPAVRFYAIDALRKLTGSDFGYLFYSDEDVRRPAVLKWKQWYESSAGPSATSPASTVPAEP